MFGTQENPFLSVRDVVERYGGAITLDTLEKWRREHVGPSYYKFGGKVLYRLADLLIWESRQRREQRRRHRSVLLWPVIAELEAPHTELERRCVAAVEQAADDEWPDPMQVLDEIEGRTA